MVFYQKGNKGIWSSQKGFEKFVRIKIILSLLLILFPADRVFSTEARVVYGEGIVQNPRYQSWDGSTWSAESSAVSVEGTIWWVVLRSCPLRNEMILGVLDASGHLNVQVWDGSIWGNLIEVTTAIDSSAYRGFDIAYEESTGEALIVYQTNGFDPRYRIWNGVSWSPEFIVDLPGGGIPRWIVLSSKPGSDEIVLMEAENSGDIYAAVWNGSNWENSATFNNTIRQANREGIGVAYEQVSKEAIAAYCPSTGLNLRYRIWNGTTWESEIGSPLVPTGTNPTQIQLASDPSSDRIVVGLADENLNLNVNIWSGTGWGGWTTATTFLREIVNRRAWDVAFEKSGKEALVVYSISGANAKKIRYRTFGTTWSPEVIGPNMSHFVNIIQLVSDPNSDNLFLGTVAGNKVLQLTRWTDSLFASPVSAETTLSTIQFEPFSIEYNCWTPSPDTATLTSITRSPNPGSINIAWNSQVGRKYNIYYADSITGTFMDIGDVTATSTSLTWTDDGTHTPSHPDSVTERHYRIKEEGGNTSSNTDGKFTIGLEPGMNMVSIPIVPYSTDLDTVIGTQLTGDASELYADRIWKWSPSTNTYTIVWLVSGGPNDRKWWNTATGLEATMTLNADEGFWIENRHGPQKVTFVGKVSDTPNRTTTLVKGIQLIGSSYPKVTSLVNSDLDEDGAKGAVSELDADRVWSWDPVTETYKFAWLIEGVGPPYDGKWWDSSTGAETTIQLKPGKGYWFELRDLSGHFDFTWTYPKPYSQPPN